MKVVPKQGRSQLEVVKRFFNFWSSVSAVKIEPSVSYQTTKAIIKGVEGVE